MEICISELKNKPLSGSLLKFRMRISKRHPHFKVGQLNSLRDHEFFFCINSLIKSFLRSMAGNRLLNESNSLNLPKIGGSSWADIGKKPKVIEGLFEPPAV